MIRLLTALFFITTLAACGGGGGGGGSSASQPASAAPPAAPEEEEPVEEPAPEPEAGFANGTFAAYQTFAQQCANPRAGFDSNGNPFPDVQGTTTDENNWLRSWSNELYLWYDEIQDVDPALFSTPDYFERMKTFALTPSGAPRDKFHFTIPTDEWLAESQSGIVGGYGATFALLQAFPPRQVVVAYTEPNTPAIAPEANLLRGTEILEIDGVDVINGNDVDTLNNGLFPGDNETHTFLVRDVGSTETRSITMTSTQITTTPVQNIGTIETTTGLVGYMTFNDHIATAEQQLIDAVNQLAAANVNDLVLDLRYNGGGFLAIASELAYMIAGPVTNGQIFEVLEFNDKHPTINPVTGSLLDPAPFLTTAQGLSAPNGTPLPDLGLSRVFVLTGPGTCSASESIINSLQGIDIEVIQIGDTTCGKPYGFYAFDNCGTTYFSIQFRGVNQKGFGDYTDGFSPQNIPGIASTPVQGCFVSDDFTRQLGDPLEGRLRAALQYREDGTCPSTVGFDQPALAKTKPQQSVVVTKSAWRTNRIIQY